MYHNVAEQFAANIDTRGETGAAFAAVRDGELVIDLWGGVADHATGKPWQRDTLLGHPMAHRVGFQLTTRDPVLPDWFGHDGAGGSSHGAWPSLNASYSYVVNRLSMTGRESRCLPLLLALNDALRS